MATAKCMPSRQKPKGLPTEVMFNSPGREIALDADILDISYTGIIVKLKHPIASDIVGHIRITMNLPESGASFSVRGILSHRRAAYASSPNYANHIVGSIDDVMFLCIELDNSTVFIKTH